LGRSDDTIKVAGKRIGPAEVENILVSHDAVTEAAVVGVPDDLKGQAVVAFVVPKPGVETDDTLREELTRWIVNELGKPLAPKMIHFVPDIPKTRNAKVMRRVIRATYLGEPQGDLAALVNPEALEPIRALGMKTSESRQ
jgi:acetyl-CoA synthetase